MSHFSGPAETWLPRLLAGHRVTLSRALTAVENETPDAGPILRAIHAHLGRALVVGFTGPPGAGKSTLVNAYIAELRRRGQTVGVVAVDPSSPLTGGAILGDRIRMGEHAGDDGVFVRSLASRGHLGGLSRTTARVVDVMDAAGKDVVVVETVGAGQSEVEVAEVTPTKVVVCPPGLGDDIQAIKAGILEIADIFVVTKCDLPHADRTVHQLGDMVHKKSKTEWRIPVIRTTATLNEGLAELADAIAAHNVQAQGTQVFGTASQTPLARIRKQIAAIAAERARRIIEAGNEAAIEELCAAVLRGDLPYDAAAAKALGVLGEGGR